MKRFSLCAVVVLVAIAAAVGTVQAFVVESKVEVDVPFFSDDASVCVVYDIVRPLEGRSPELRLGAKAGFDFQKRLIFVPSGSVMWVDGAQSLVVHASRGSAFEAGMKYIYHF
jgi:hypothetical protein